jgi:hypothetical protein
MNRKERRRKREERKKKRDDALLESAWSEADATAQHVPLEKLREMAVSDDAYERLMALMLARKQIREGAAPGDFFQLAQGLIRDRDNNCRWQAVIVIAESIDVDPDAVWQVVSQFGNSTDYDMRSAIGCGLLEHLLDDHFEVYFPRVQAEILRGRHRFIETLAMCWFDDCSGPNFLSARSFVKEQRVALRLRK